jgi:hypothetical protein
MQYKGIKFTVQPTRTGQCENGHVTDQQKLLQWLLGTGE